MTGDVIERTLNTRYQRISKQIINLKEIHIEKKEHTDPHALLQSSQLRLIHGECVFKKFFFLSRRRLEIRLNNPTKTGDTR